MTDAQDNKAQDDKAQDTVDAAADAAHDAVSKTADSAADVVERASDSATEAVGSATGAAKEAIGSATGVAEDAVDAVHKSVSKGLHQASRTAADISDKASATVKEYPTQTVLIVAAAAAVIGFMAGLLTARRD